MSTPPAAPPSTAPLVHGEWDILEKVARLLREERANDVPNEDPVIRFHHPDQLKSLLDLAIDSSPYEGGRPPAPQQQPQSPGTSLAEAEDQGQDEAVLHLCRSVVRLSVRTGHRFFANQLFGGCDPVGLAGSWLTEALNTSQYTFEVAPVFTLIESVLVAKCLQLFRFPGDGEGLFSPGGSMSNMYALTLARYRLNPAFKRTGVFGSAPLVAFTSTEAHYSIQKAVHWLGLGLDNLCLVPTNDRGQMCPAALEAAVARVLAEGRVPFFVNATAGTTVLGAFDDFPAVADVCARHGLWLHVDACLGGSAVLSRARREELLGGVERADSLAWNPHKSLGVPLQCSLFLTRHPQLLHKANAANAEYLFQQDKFYDTSYDSGDKSVQCGRKVDAFKFWLMLKVRGLAAFEAAVDHNFALRDFLVARLRTRRNFRLVLPAFQYTNVCFWYVPDRLLLAEGQPETPEWWRAVCEVTTRIKERMVVEGSAMISYCPLKHKGLGNFFRMVFTAHPRRTTQDVDDLLEVIRRTGETV